MFTSAKLFTEQEVLELMKQATVKTAKGSNDDQEQMLITMIGARIATEIMEAFREMKKEAK